MKKLVIVLLVTMLLVGLLGVVKLSAQMFGYDITFLTDENINQIANIASAIFAGVATLINRTEPIVIEFKPDK